MPWGRLILSLIIVLGIILLAVANYHALRRSFIRLDPERGLAVFQRQAWLLMLTPALALILAAAFLWGRERRPARRRPPPAKVMISPPPVEDSSAYRQLREERRYLFDDSFTYQLAIGRDGKLRDANQNLLQLLNRGIPSLVGHGVLDLLAPAHREEFQRYLARHFDEKLSGEIEVEFETPAGRRVVRFGERHCLIRENYIPVGIIITGLDVTDLRAGEEREREFKKRLALSSRMESLGILAGGIAHDLKNLFSPLFAYPDFILKQLPADSPLRPTLRSIKESAWRASEIIHNFLTMARRGKSEFMPMDINQVIGVFFELPDFRDLLERFPAVTVKTALDQESICCQGLPSQLMSAVINVVRNAFEAMPAGGELEIATRRVRFDWPHKGFQQIPRGEYGLIRVSDSGVGINKDALHHLFMPFASAKTLDRSGTGLGLTVVAGVLEDHGGFLDVESRPGGGTIFSMYLPVQPPDAAAGDLPDLPRLPEKEENL